MNPSTSRVFSMPTDDQSATDLLNYFNDMAYSTSYKNMFTKAASILFGSSIVTKVDLSKRMLFKCMSCNKEMNNVRSLKDHALSGSHLKIIDSEVKEYSLPDLNHLCINAGDIPKNKLQERISKSALPIVGLNRVEAFNDGGQNWYYKCTLCCAHGNADCVYNHLIGDKHTDRYIKSRVVLKSTTINQEERNHLRSLLLAKENFNVLDIKTIYGAAYYPYIWERDGKMGYTSKNKIKLYELDEEIPLIQNEASAYLPVVEIPYPQNEAAAYPTVGEPDDKVRSSFKYYQVLIKKLRSMTSRLEKEENGLKNDMDVCVVTSVLSFLLHWIFFVNNKLFTETQSSKYVEQREVIMSMLGHVEKKMKVSLKSKYPDFDLD